MLRSTVRDGGVTRRGLRRTMPVALGVLACAPLVVAATRAVSVRLDG
ncbi:MAG: hypothetical protein ACJ72W_23155 [Actinoallomurus sp.]